jgi:predicted O-linked N-acetylglucosamine transferase (SPINDLY family)
VNSITWYTTGFQILSMKNAPIDVSFYAYNGIGLVLWPHYDMNVVSDHVLGCIF